MMLEAIGPNEASLRKVRESNDATEWFLVVNTSKEMLTNAPAYTKNTKS